MKAIQSCIDCIKSNEVVNEVVDSVITKCEETIDEIIDLSKLKVIDDRAYRPTSRVRYAQQSSDQPDESDSENTIKIKTYYVVLCFSTKHKFKLKEKNKIKTAVYEAFSVKQQQVLFKRKVDEWREVCVGKIEVVPEFTEKQNLHFNIILRAYDDITPKDIQIAFCDAYGIPWAMRNIAVFVREIKDQEALERTKVYLKKENGKEYQKTGLYWEFLNM